jgi:hypothetical protein
MYMLIPWQKQSFLWDYHFFFCPKSVSIYCSNTQILYVDAYGNWRHVTVYAVCLIRNRCRSEAVKWGMEVHYRNNIAESNAQNYICLILITFENVHCRILVNLKLITMRQFCLTSIHIIGYHTDRLHFWYFKFQNYWQTQNPMSTNHQITSECFKLGATMS